jgi:hypothetical protein
MTGRMISPSTEFKKIKRQKSKGKRQKVGTYFLLNQAARRDDPRIFAF